MDFRLRFDFNTLGFQEDDDDDAVELSVIIFLIGKIVMVFEQISFTYIVNSKYHKTRPVLDIFLTRHQRRVVSIQKVFSTSAFLTLKYKINRLFA